jgi:hypothetical protein
VITEEIDMDRPTAEQVEPTPPTLVRAPVQLWLVAILMSVSFGAGFLLQPTADPAPSPPAQLAPAPARIPVAPPLSDAQLEEAELPAGHPPLDATGDDTSDDAGDDAGDVAGDGSDEGASPPGGPVP